MPGLQDAMAALMQQFGGSAPSAYQTNQAAASVPSWTPAPANNPGVAPMAAPFQSAIPQNPILAALQNPQSYGQPQGGSMARQGVDALGSAALTAALTPMLGPAATTVGPVIGQIATSLIPHKGGQQQQAPMPAQPRPMPAPSSINPMDDQYVMLLQMLQNGGMRM